MIKIWHISDTHGYHDLLEVPDRDTIYSNGSVMKDGSFGRLTSNGNIFEL